MLLTIGTMPNHDLINQICEFTSGVKTNSITREYIVCHFERIDCKISFIKLMAY